MRDDAVLGRALPLDRGLGPSTAELTAGNSAVQKRNEIAEKL